jgi:hypothetical protein
MKNPLYKQIAGRINAYNNCIKINNKEWEEKHLEILESYNDNLPSGSGFDSGSKISIEDSTDNKIVIYTSYHFMNENGFYDGWEDYKIIVTPSLQFDFDLKIIGKNRNEIKDYMYEVFADCLHEAVE